MSRWPEVAIGDVAQPVDRPEQPVPGVTYRQIGVRLWGEGAYERESIDGAETKYKTLNRVAAGDIIVNKIWARNGSVSVVPDDLDGCFCSGEFPLFRPDAAKLDPRWFFWITKTRWFWDRCDQQSRGTSGKNRLRPQKFLEIPIPLAPIEEQRRVVRKIEQLAARLDLVGQMRLRVTALDSAVITSTVTSTLANLKGGICSLADVLREPSRNGISTRPSREPPGVPVLRISAATSRPDGAVDENDVSYLSVDRESVSDYLLQPGDLLACRFNGNLSYVGRFSRFVGESGDQRIYPDKLIRFRVDTARALPEFVCLAMNSVESRVHIESCCQTTAGNIGISATSLKRMPVTIPSLQEQKMAVSRVARLIAIAERMRTQRVRQTEALDALLPAILQGVSG